MTRYPLRLVAGCVLALTGVMALFLAWYGVSGTPITAKQVPYLVSGGLSGVCLLVLAAACFAADDVRRSLDRVTALEQTVQRLHDLLTEPAGAAADELVALQGGSSYHRPSCRLVQGKTSAVAIDLTAAESRGLAACRLCDPPHLRVA